MKEIIIKVLRENEIQYKADKPSLAAIYWQENIATQDSFDHEKEHVIVLLMDTKNNIKSHNMVSIGIVNSCMTHAREVFKPAIVESAAHIILMHNHPSGDTQQSRQDVAVTDEIKHAGKILGIPLLDHVIVSSDGKNFNSLKEIGLI